MGLPRRGCQCWLACWLLATASFRRRQEEWLFAVKRVLADAGLGDAFWMGNLKSKDLQGEAMGSQLAADVPPPSPPSDDEAAADEHDSDEEQDAAAEHSDGDAEAYGASA